MKLSLRNVALAGLMLVAGAATAATPTVKLDWQRQITKAEGFVYNNGRGGAGINDKIYFVDKGTAPVAATETSAAVEEVVGKVYCYDHATDAVTKVVDLPTWCGVGLTVDDAGNILVNRNFPNAPSSNTFYIVSTEGVVSELNIKLPTEVAAGRCDLLGRVTGNLLSDEGGIFFLHPAGANNVAMVYVVNGVQDKDTFSFYSSNTTKHAGASTALAQPMYTVTELIDMGDDAINGCAYGIRNGNKYYWDFEAGGWAAWTKPTGSQSSDGFEVFNLGGVNYQVVPTSTDAKYNSTFSIADFAGNVIYTDERGALGTGSYQNGATYTARKIDENTVELYTYYPLNAGLQVAKFTVSLPAEEPVAPLYAVGTIQGWDIANPIEVPYADGKWTLDLGETASAGFKISTVAGEGNWDNFNAGALGIGDADSQLVLGTVYDAVVGAKGNLTVSGKGTYKVEIAKKGEGYTITLVGELAPIAAPDAADVYLRGDFNTWGADDAFKFQDAGVEGTARKYTVYVKEAISGQFKVGDASWTSINFGGEEGATIVVGPKYNLVNNGQNLTADALADVTFIFMHSGDPAVASTLQLRKGDVGVDEIEVAEEGVATYYNLQGVEVNGENLSNGVYVKVVNGKASKVLVK